MGDNQLVDIPDKRRPRWQRSNHQKRQPSRRQEKAERPPRMLTREWKRVPWWQTDWET